MYIFEDILNGKEVVSDALPYSEVCDGMLLKFIGSNVKKSYGIDDSLIGGNKSAEDPDEGGADDETTTKLDILEFDIQQIPVGKKDFLSFIKTYCKAVKKQLEENGQLEEAKEFQAGAPAATKFLLKDFKDLEFYAPTDNEPEGGYGYLNWEEVDGKDRPYILYFKHGLRKVKV